MRAKRYWEEKKKRKSIEDEIQSKRRNGEGGRKGIGASYRISVVYPRGSVTVRTLESRLHPPRPRTRTSAGIRHVEHV